MIDIPCSFADLEKLFSELGVPTSEIEFYNTPSFMKAEADNSSVLELYAAFVRMRERDADYEADVRRIVPIVADKLAEEIQSDGQLGACVDVAQMLNKILEELGIWSYSVQGSLTITNPALPNPTHFWMFDQQQIPGHVWVVAPPFEIIDVTLKAQPYQRQEAQLVPTVVTSEGGERITPRSDDFFEPSLLLATHHSLGGAIATVHERSHPGIMSAVRFFPSWLVKVGKTQLRYAVGGISLSDAPNLDAIKNRTWNGRYASAVLEDVIRPALRTASHKGS